MLNTLARKSGNEFRRRLTFCLHTMSLVPWQDYISEREQIQGLLCWRQYTMLWGPYRLHTDFRTTLYPFSEVWQGNAFILQSQE